MALYTGIGRCAIGRALRLSPRLNSLPTAGPIRLDLIGCRTRKTFLTVSVLYQEESWKTKKNDQTHSHAASSASHSHDHTHDTSTSSSIHSHSHTAGGVFGHSHSHSNEDNVFLQEKGGLKNPAIRITCIGLLVNIGMAIGKGVGGVVFHSQALLADSVHALSDLVSDFLTLATISIGSRPVSEHFPNGYGKFETLGSLGVSTLLVLAGVSMGWSGLVSMLHHLFGDNSWLEMMSALGGHSHSHGASSDEAANLNAAWLALASIGVKEWLYKTTIKVADQTGSNVLVANAWHHRIDSLVSMVAVATIGGGYLFGINWLDPLGGLIVSCVIAKAGYSTAKQAALELADSNSGITQGDRHRLEAHREIVLSALENIELQHADLAKFAVSHIDAMPSGPNLTSTIVLNLKDKNASLDDFRKVSAMLQHNLTSENKFLRRVVVTLDEKQAP